MIRSRRVTLTLTAGLILALGYFFGGCGSTGTWEAERDIDIGGTIIFSSNRGGSWNLITSDFSGDHPNIITSDIAGEHRWGVWSDDGQSVYLSSKTADNWDLAVIDDVSDPSGTWELLLDATGDQMFPRLTPDETGIVYLHLPDGEYVPQINLFDIASETVTELTDPIDAGEMEVDFTMRFIPGTNDLMYIDDNILYVVDIDTGTSEQYVFTTDAGNGFRHENFTLTGHNEGFCSGVELNRTIFSLDRWDLTDPDVPEHLIDARKGSAVNFWFGMTWFEEGSDEYILLASKPDIGAYQRWVGVIDIGAESWTVRFVSGAKTADNVHPDWTSVVHY